MCIYSWVRKENGNFLSKGEKKGREIEFVEKEPEERERQRGRDGQRERQRERQR